MHPRLAPLVDRIEAQRSTLLATIAGQPASVLETKPAPDHWSPSQVLEHLAIVESGVARLLARRLQRAQEAGLGMESSTEPIDSSRWGAAYMGRKIEAPENVRPPGQIGADDAIAHLAAAHVALRETLAAADGYDLSSVMAQHQIFGDLNMYEWLGFLPAHEQRHVAQIARSLKGDVPLAH